MEYQRLFKHFVVAVAPIINCANLINDAIDGDVNVPKMDPEHKKTSLRACANLNAQPNIGIVF